MSIDSIAGNCIEFEGELSRVVVGPVNPDLAVDDFHRALNGIADSRYGLRPSREKPGVHSIYLEHPTRPGESVTTMELRPELGEDGYRHVVITVQNPNDPNVPAPHLKSRIDYIARVLRSSGIMCSKDDWRVLPRRPESPMRYASPIHASLY